MFLFSLVMFPTILRTIEHLKRYYKAIYIRIVVAQDIQMYLCTVK